jgi:hypothetical protein
MGNFSWKGTTSGKQYGAYGGQTMYTIGGGVFDAYLQIQMLHLQLFIIL